MQDSKQANGRCQLVRSQSLCSQSLCSQNFRSSLLISIGFALVFSTFGCSSFGSKINHSHFTDMSKLLDAQIQEAPSSSSKPYFFATAENTIIEAFGSKQKISRMIICFPAQKTKLSSTGLDCLKRCATYANPKDPNTALKWLASAYHNQEELGKNFSDAKVKTSMNKLGTSFCIDMRF